MVELLRRGRVLTRLLLLLAGCASDPGSPTHGEPDLVPRDVLERATSEFVDSYRAWVTRVGTEPPAVRLDRLLNMTGRGGSVVGAENVIIEQLAILDVPVITDKPGEVPPDVVYDLQIEASEEILRSGDLEATKTTLYFKLFEPNGKRLVASHAFQEQVQREVE